MQHIFFTELSLEEGFKVLEQPVKHDRLAKGRRVDRPSGWKLFHHLKGQPIRCHFCGCEADRWVAEKGRKDKVGNAVLNLYSVAVTGQLVLMTRDHIIPRSLGGVDEVGNLRPACAPCNHNRANEVTLEVIRFAQEHPELVDDGRVKAGLEGLRERTRKLRETAQNIEIEIERLEKPFKDMGYL